MPAKDSLYVILSQDSSDNSITCIRAITQFAMEKMGHFCTWNNGDIQIVNTKDLSKSIVTLKNSGIPVTFKEGLDGSVLYACFCTNGDINNILSSD